jgi:hypothetical protein
MECRNDGEINDWAVTDAISDNDSDWKENFTGDFDSQNSMKVVKDTVTIFKVIFIKFVWMIPTDQLVCWTNFSFSGTLNFLKINCYILGTGNRGGSFVHMLGLSMLMDPIQKSEFWSLSPPPKKGYTYGRLWWHHIRECPELTCKLLHFINKEKERFIPQITEVLLWFFLLFWT